EGGLVIHYPSCGRSTPRAPADVLRRACRLKQQHTHWGGALIRVELLRLVAAAMVPSVRTLQRAFQRDGINRPRRTQRPRTIPTRPEAPHDLWEVDAVEKKRPRTGTEVSWLSAVDASSGPFWRASFPPQAQWQTIPPQDARALFRRVFARWGLPRAL